MPDWLSPNSLTNEDLIWLIRSGTITPSQAADIIIHREKMRRKPRQGFFGWLWRLFGWGR